MENKRIFLTAALALVIGVLGFYPHGVLSLRFGKQLVSEWVLISLVALFFIKNPWVKLFLLWSIIQATPIYSKWIHFSINTLFLHLVVYQWLSNSLNPKRIERLLDAICVVGIIQTIFMMFQANGLYFMTKPFCRYMGAHYGMMSHHNSASALLALCLPAFFRHKWNLLIPFIWIGLFLSKSIGGIAPAFVITYVYVWIVWKSSRLHLIFLLFLLVVFLLSPYNTNPAFSSSGRFTNWIEIFRRMISAKWLFGWGLGNFKIVWPQLFPVERETFLQAHNEYIQVWAELEIGRAHV